MQSNNEFSYLLVGFGAGLALGMLFAPKSGSDTRNYLHSKAEDAARQIKEQSGKVMDTANETIGRAKGMANQTIGRVQGMMQQSGPSIKETVGV